MPRAAELLQQGRTEELWEMCCGFTSLNTAQFMGIQERLLLEQLELLNNCPLGAKLLQGAKPRTVAEFRRYAPLTTYADYCPELLERQEETLPAKPAMWVHTSGRSGEYPFKWVPISHTFTQMMSAILYGVGNLSNCRGRGDTSRLPLRPQIVYTVAPRPYISGAMASMIELQTPLDFMPNLKDAEEITFEERIKLGFREALSQGLDYFFGISMVLVAVGDKFQESSQKVALRPLLKKPKALLRLGKGLVKSKLARRPMLPKDLWQVRGIISSGLDSWVYRDRIKKLWGRYPLDIYASTEGGVLATQTWDYGSMTFIPNLNFLEFIPEEEHFKWQLDRSYQPRILLLDEVQPGENYEIVITNFHGGALVRYRVGDMIRITSLRNEQAGIALPQMVFERRVDGLLDFYVVRLTEKTIWQAIEKTGIAYQDWTAYKIPGEQVLHLLIEVKDGTQANESEIARDIYRQIMETDNSERASMIDGELSDAVGFKIDVTLLPRGAFSIYTAQRQAEGADLAHLKPPHLNPSEKVLSLLKSGTAPVKHEDREAVEASQLPVS